jgi:hypothetical protein
MYSTVRRDLPILSTILILLAVIIKKNNIVLQQGVPVILTMA